MGLFQERENTAHPTGRGDVILYCVVGLFVVLGILTGTAMLVNRVVCGAWARPNGIFDVFSFIGSGDPAVFGTTPNGCAASSTAVLIAWAVVAAVIITGTIMGVIAYRNYLQSDRYFVKAIQRRNGIAKRQEVKTIMGAKQARQMTAKIRPTLPKKQLSPQLGNIRLGNAEGVECWASMEDSLVLIGPPRSGKGVNVLANAIIDAPGPVITTSSRADNYAMTAGLRAKRGPVTLFDPQGLTGKPTTLKWSPITGCDSPQTANQRATSLISSAGLSEDSSNAEWRSPAVTIMQALLHACALVGESVDTLMLWGTSPAKARDAVKVLREQERAGRAARGWASALEAVIDSDPKMRQNKWFGVENAVSGLSVDSVRDVMNPRTRGEAFDIDEFIAQSGTLYIIGTRTGGSSAGPFLVAMMDAITERAREIAAKREGNRLDPPMALVLDEIANITRAWDGLVPLMADGGGTGITVLAVFQSMAQVRNSWGEQAASALFDAATIKILLGGASNTDDLQVFSTLAGRRKVMRSSTSRQKDGTSVSDQVQEMNVLEVDELRRLPFGYTIILMRNKRPIFMRLSPYYKSINAGPIAEMKKLYAQSLLDDDADERWEATLYGQTVATPASADLEAAPDTVAEVGPAGTADLAVTAESEGRGEDPEVEGPSRPTVTWY